MLGYERSFMRKENFILDSMTTGASEELPMYQFFVRDEARRELIEKYAKYADEAVAVKFYPNKQCAKIECSHSVFGHYPTTTLTYDEDLCEILTEVLIEYGIEE